MLTNKRHSVPGYSFVSTVAPSPNFSAWLFLIQVAMFILTSLLSLVAHAGSATNIEGQCLEQLQWQGDYLVNYSSTLGIAYRWNSERRSYLLVTPVKANAGCGGNAGHIIIASLSVGPEKEGEWYGINFDCSNSRDVKTGDVVITLFKGRGLGQSIAAWKVDPTKKRFVTTENVQCKSFS